MQSAETLSLERRILTVIDDHNYCSFAWDLTVYTEDVVAYIAGFVVKVIKKCVSYKCLILLEGTDNVSVLQERKKYGRLVNASNTVVKICTLAEKHFRFFNETSGIFNKNNKNLIATLIQSTMQKLPSNILDDFGSHVFDDEVIDGHVVTLLKLILQKYFYLRIHYGTSKKADFRRKPRVRSILTKTILFRHE